MRVVILAAGLGARLGGDLPKPLSQIAPGRTLLGNQIDILGRLVSSERITLVLGHRAGEIRAVHPKLRCVINERYAHTNTAKSLLCGLNGLDDDVLWTNADLYFEEDAARRLLDAEALGARLLVNTAKVADEEIKYTLYDDGSIARLSKVVPDPAGESLGMQIVARADLPAFVAQLEAVDDQDYFEKALENCTLGRTIRVMPVAISGEYCREVDYPADLDEVRRYLAGGGAE